MIHSSSFPSRWLVLGIVSSALTDVVFAADAGPVADARIEALEKRIAELERQSVVHPKSKPTPTLIDENSALAESEDLDPLANRVDGKDIPGNVSVSDSFRIQLGGSLRMHTQYK